MFPRRSVLLLLLISIHFVTEMLIRSSKSYSYITYVLYFSWPGGTKLSSWQVRTVIAVRYMWFTHLTALRFPRRFTAWTCYVQLLTVKKCLIRYSTELQSSFHFRSNGKFFPEHISHVTLKRNLLESALFHIIYKIMLQVSFSTREVPCNVRRRVWIHRAVRGIFRR